MKLNVKLQNEWFVLPTTNRSEKVAWIVEETIRRFLCYSTEKRKQLKEPLSADRNNGVVDPKLFDQFIKSVVEIRKNATNAILHESDLIHEVLNDDDFLCIVLKSDLESFYQERTVDKLQTLALSLEPNKNEKKTIFYLDGNTLKPDDLFELGLGKHKIDLTREAWKNVADGRQLLDDLIKDNVVVYRGKKYCIKRIRTKLNFEQNPRGRFLRLSSSLERFCCLMIENSSEGQVAAISQTEEESFSYCSLYNHFFHVFYGINTGFGRFASTLIDKTDLKQLQLNLIRSHASGTGKTLDLERTRRLLLLRINVLAKGHSGISPETLQGLIDAFNADCLSWVPEQGTVGASGDLAPLSHLALGLIGEGKMYSPVTGWTDARLALEAHNLKPIQLKPKEGIALINGTQLITSLGAEAVICAERIAKQADIVAAITLEVLKGTTRAFDQNIHDLRPHKGQSLVAETLRSLLHSEIYKSEIAESHRFCQRVQDAYTIRCCPQVHGIVHDTIEFVKQIIQTEMNSATDNPLVIPKMGECISGGNFHGEYPAKVCDYLAIAVHELASISERRIDRLMNTALSGLPLFLVQDGGLNSGLMIPHCTAASLVAENKVLCHPASIDSISTSAGTEDHVSMGGMASRKVLQVVENVEKVIAIELLAACQAMEFLRPLKSTEPIEAIYQLVREHVLPLDSDRFLAPEIEKVYQLLKQNAIYDRVKPYIANYKMKIRKISKKISIAERPSSPTTFFSNTFAQQHPELQLDRDSPQP